MYDLDAAKKIEELVIHARENVYKLQWLDNKQSHYVQEMKSCEFFDGKVGNWLNYGNGLENTIKTTAVIGALGGVAYGAATGISPLNDSATEILSSVILKTLKGTGVGVGGGILGTFAGVALGYTVGSINYVARQFNTLGKMGLNLLQKPSQKKELCETIEKNKQDIVEEFTKAPDLLNPYLGNSYMIQNRDNLNLILGAETVDNLEKIKTEKEQNERANVRFKSVSDTLLEVSSRYKYPIGSHKNGDDAWRKIRDKKDPRIDN